MPGKGLEGVVAGDSSICLIDGKTGKLLYRGYSIDELARKSSFEEVTYLLVNGHLPTKGELAAFSKRLAGFRELSAATWGFLADVPKGRHPMDVLQAGLALENLHAPERDPKDSALSFLARAATITANHLRREEGKSFVRPKGDLSHAADFLYMILGKRAPPAWEKALDTSLVLYAEHEFNASTFATRVAASTLADMPTSLLAGITVLEGPLHGAANRDAMELLLAVGKPERAQKYIREVLARGGKVAGMGHRVYKTKDPRAYIYEGIAKRLDPELYKVAAAVEKACLVEFVEKRNLPVYPNVDFYSGIAFRKMGIPPAFYPNLFAMARIAGWAAHVLEQWKDNRLIRPLANYTGPAEQPYPK
jgi:citrate synthase